jgi:hypothetical protein
MILKNLVDMPPHALRHDMLYQKFNYNHELTDPLHNSTRNKLTKFYRKANQDLAELLEKHHHRSQNYDWLELLSHQTYKTREL